MEKNRPVVSLSERAVLARVNRALRPKGQRMCRHRPNWQGFDCLGRFYLLDYTTSTVVDTQIDLETFGRELNVIAAWEEMRTSPRLLTHGRDLRRRSVERSSR